MADPSLAGVADATKTAKWQVRTAARASQHQLKEGFVSVEGAVHAAQLELASERGSSAWLTSRPLSCHGFRLSKSEFRDVMCLRYGWVPERLPSSCVCGNARVDVSHALSCPTADRWISVLKT